MKKKYLALFLILFITIFVYAERGIVRDFFIASIKTSVPKAHSYTNIQKQSADMIIDSPSNFEGGNATSQHYVLESSPTLTRTEKKDLLDIPIPPEINLDIPFTIQSPDQIWDELHNEACEEASLIMVNAYYTGQTGNIPVSSAMKSIVDITDYENTLFGYNKSTTIEQTAQIAKGFFHLNDIHIIHAPTVQGMKMLLAKGIPIIVPAAGRLLGNTHFRGAGPMYHMLVLKGYTRDGNFIVNDPGTRVGKDFVYSFDILMNAMHDYNENDILAGGKVILTVSPATTP